MKSKSGEHMVPHFQRGIGYVYLARGYKGLVKVGGAFSAENRMRSLRIKDHSIKLIAKIRSERYMYLEKFIHAELAEFKVANEWYRNEKEIIKKVIAFLQKHGDIFGAYDIFFTSASSQKTAG